MSFAHKVVLWLMQRRGYLVGLKKSRIFSLTLLFCSKADFRSANLTSEVIFFNSSRFKVHFPDLEVCCDWSTYFSAQVSRRSWGRNA